MTHAREMTPEERAAALAALKSPTPEPPPKLGDPQPKMAKDMTPADREKFLKELKRRFG